MDVNVKVAVRCRPMSQKEIARGCKEIVKVDSINRTVHIDETLSQQDSKSASRDFSFDHCYSTDSTQQQVYDDLGKPIVTQAIDGFNGTIFAYGIPLI